MSVDVKFSIGLLLGAALVFVYYKWCESRMAG